MYKTYVRPLLEYNTQIWSPHLICDIDKIERVQKFLTKRLPGLRNTPYLERLRITDLKSLEERRIINDLVFFYKMMHGFVDIDKDNFLTINQNATRGHSFKVNHQSARLNSRKYFFINRTIPIWNALTQEQVSSPSITSFKNSIANTSFHTYCRGHAHTAT